MSKLAHCLLYKGTEGNEYAKEKEGVALCMDISY